MLKSPKLSVYKIDSEYNFPFDIKDYSYFKFGKREITKCYADKLTFLISEYINKNNIENKIVIYPSPYSFIPTASCHMTFIIYENLKSIFKEINISKSKIKRKNTYYQDYGNLNKEERYNLIKNDTYEIIEYPHEDSILFFIDDIAITGTHQQIIEETLEENKISNSKVFFYLAELINKDLHPNIENKLNYSSVNTCYDLIKLFSEKNFLLNTRFTKKILSLPKEELQLFINSFITEICIENLTHLVDSCYQNNYDKIELYKSNLSFLTNSLVNLKAID